jgi:hypothetical protein
MGTIAKQGASKPPNYALSWLRWGGSGRSRGALIAAKSLDEAGCSAEDPATDGFGEGTPVDRRE